MSLRWAWLLAGVLALPCSAQITHGSHGGGGGGGGGGSGHSGTVHVSPTPMAPAQTAPMSPAPMAPAPSRMAPAPSRLGPAPAGIGRAPRVTAPSAPAASRPPMVRPISPRASGPIGTNGAPLQPRADPPGAVSIIRNPNFPAASQRLIVADTQPNVFFFHTFNGFRFCHFIDPFGVGWFGFWWGPGFYWTTYWDGFWWWYQPVDAQWLYFDDSSDSWVPSGAAPAAGPPPAAPAQTAGATVISPDGRRMVQLVDGQAFLYDRTPKGAATFRAFLAKDAHGARWSGDRIVLDLRGGGTATFDRDGKPLTR